MLNIPFKSDQQEQSRLIQCFSSAIPSKPSQKEKKEKKKISRVLQVMRQGKSYSVSNAHFFVNDSNGSFLK